MLQDEKLVSPMNEEEILEQIKSMAPWFHNLHFSGGIQTAPDHFLGDFPAFKWKDLSPHIPADLDGWKVLDIGCNAGFYSFELAKRGAIVTGIDLDPHYLRQAEWAASQYELEDRVSFRQMQVYDLTKTEESFDMIWFMGVFYHLRYPLLALDIISQKLNKLLIFQTLMMPDKEKKRIADDYPINDRKEMLEMGWPKMAFIEKRLSGDPTNWWAPNQEGVEAMMRSCGLRVVKNPMDETFLCEKDEGHPSVLSEWNRSEFLSATGQLWQDDLQNKVVK